MAQFLKIYKKTALSWWFEVDGNGELRTISDFEVNIGNSFNIVEIDGSKIFVNNIANVTIIDETNSTNFTFISPILLEQKLRALNFVPYRDQSIVADSGIVDAPAIPGTGTTVMTFDEIRYHGLTAQTGPISLSLNATPNINKNGRIQVLDINGNSVNTFTPPANSINSNGVAFDNTKNNVIYFDFVNGKVKYNITLQNIPDLIAPTLILVAVKDPNLNNIILIYNEALVVSPLPSFSDFSLNLSKTVTGISIVGSVVTLTVNSPYSIGDLPTIGYTGGVNKIKDLAGNNAANLVNQVITNNIGVMGSDSFTSANIADISGRITPIGGRTWVHNSGAGNIGIVNNEAKLTSAAATADDTYTFDNGVRNIDVSFVIGTIGSGLTFFVAYQNSDNYIAVFAHLSAVLVRSGGANTILYNPSVSAGSGDVLRVVLTSTIITLYKNGPSIFTQTGGAHVNVLGTSVGFNLYQDGVSTINSIT